MSGIFFFVMMFISTLWMSNERTKFFALWIFRKTTNTSTIRKWKFSWLFVSSLSILSKIRTFVSVFLFNNFIKDLSQNNISLKKKYLKKVRLTHDHNSHMKLCNLILTCTTYLLCNTFVGQMFNQQHNVSIVKVIVTFCLTWIVLWT